MDDGPPEDQVQVPPEHEAPPDWGSEPGSSSCPDNWDALLPPPERLSVLDLVDNLALPLQLEKLHRTLAAHTDRVRRSRDALRSRTRVARNRMVDEWRRRLPSADEQLVRYRARMRRRVDRLARQWSDAKTVSLRQKVSFVCAVFNIFFSGYLLGAAPHRFHLWYTAQLVYFLPIRFIVYRRRGYHYFLADLCYFVNLLLLLSLWPFPRSKRLFTAAYCLAFGNNAIAIVMWRNSLVFHSFDKVTSLFIHIMPCATLHCLVHLLPPDLQRTRFPAIWTIKTSAPGEPTAYANLVSMLAWSTIPYALWQLAYYLFITVRRRDKIAAGRPTSFTWLRRSYSKTWIGSLVLSLPPRLQEPAFMMIQYAYAALTILPCPIWFASRPASSVFLLVVFAWSIYNGSTYYIDVFGRRFQTELEAMKAEVLKWQNTPELAQPQSPRPAPSSEAPPAEPAAESAEPAAQPAESTAGHDAPEPRGASRTAAIPLLHESPAHVATGVDYGPRDIPRGPRAVDGLHLSSHE